MTDKYHELAEELKNKGIHHSGVLNAIATTPRHIFTGEEMQYYAAEDTALPIGHSQTISQPYIVAKMTQLLLESGPVNKILEIGTGSGYQAAILSHLVSQVYTIERIQALQEQSTARFKALNLKNIETHYGDGRLGWPEHAPYDAIIVTAASNEVPPALLQQLKDGGRMVIPVGNRKEQSLYLIDRQGDKLITQILDPVVFVPLLSGRE